MRKGLYLKLAASNLVKNRRLYIPHILAGMGLTAVFYIILTLAMDNMLGDIRGGAYLADIMPLGVAVMVVLSVIMVLYTNSFLMKQRQHEFGLYNVLGMEKRHIGRILLCETLISTCGVVVGGLFFGVALYKLATLFLCRILHIQTVLGFYYLSPRSMLPTALLFGGLYLLTFVFNRIRLARLNPVELMSGSHSGEKEPRVKWVFLVLGLLALGGGYFIAITTEQPLDALLLFFVAVILVIVGTYCLFMAGSIALLKAMKKNKKFYYHPKHMTAVSGMLYRMKQNAVGLASIAILSTCVLVMVSTTVSLYAGTESTLDMVYPHELVLSGEYSSGDSALGIHSGGAPGTDTSLEVQQLIKQWAWAEAERSGVKITYCGERNVLGAGYILEDGGLAANQDPEGDYYSTDYVMIFFLTSEEYQRLTGNDLQLGQGELAWIATRDVSLNDTLTFAGQEYRLAKHLDQFPAPLQNMLSVGLVVDSQETLDTIEAEQPALYTKWDHEVLLDYEGTEAQKARFEASLEQTVEDNLSQLQIDHNGNDGYGYSWHSRTEQAEYFYGMYGSLFFLGLILGIVFLFSTALILYYKQITEGYEDQKRFQVMQQVGMSSGEVKKTIHSQILMVFFLPLLTAALHTAMAFPMLTRIMSVLFPPSNLLFLLCTLATYLVFALIYVVLYALTARTYYKIVRR